MDYKILSAEEAASYITDGMSIGFSGFTAAGCPKAVTQALAKVAEEEHAKGNPFQVGIYTGASTGDQIDGVLARANAIKFRTPYQSNGDLRSSLNKQEAHYFDYHLSQLAQDLRYNFLPKVDVAIMECSDITPEGYLIPTSGVGIGPTACNMADKIIIELNQAHPKELYGMHDIYQPLDPPYRREIPIYRPNDKIGTPYIQIDPSKVVGVVKTDIVNQVAGFTPLDEVTKKIGANTATFLAAEMKAGRLPKEFLPVQSGVGNIANAVMFSLGDNTEIPPFSMYTEVIQDSVIDLMKSGRCTFASGCSLTLSTPMLKDVYANLDFYRDKLILRPSEITNHPELVRRMGLITINTALEADIFGNINSTHVVGTKMMNGIGGSGDFTRNAYLSIFTTPSTAKGGKISSIVPMVSHLDHSEHSVNILITEYGVADLRGKSPVQRAEEIINNCVHPDYQALLREYVELSAKAHTPHTLKAAFEFHIAFNETGDMSNADFSSYKK